MMSLWDALRMNMMISYQELVRTFLNCYAKLTINGEVLYEVDAINMIEVVDGVDLMEEHRNAIGL